MMKKLAKTFITSSYFGIFFIFLMKNKESILGVMNKIDMNIIEYSFTVKKLKWRFLQVLSIIQEIDMDSSKILYHLRSSIFGT